MSVSGLYSRCRLTCEITLAIDSFCVGKSYCGLQYLKEWRKIYGLLVETLLEI